MQELSAEHAQRDQARVQAEAQLKAVVSQILTPEARQRLTNVRLARPEFAQQVEVLLVQLAQAGKLPSKVSDEQLKKILEQIKAGKREMKIDFK